jgi:hypothetical protein
MIMDNAEYKYLVLIIRDTLESTFRSPNKISLTIVWVSAEVRIERFRNAGKKFFRSSYSGR